MREPKFVPKTSYVIHIVSTPEKVWEALTSTEFTTRFFFGRSVEIEPKVGGSFILRMPDGRFDIKGRVVEWDPPRRLSVTWGVDWMEFRELPESLVTYDIEPMGESVKLTMTKAFRWEVPDAILAGPPGLAVHPLEPQERPGNRQAGPRQRQDGSAEGDDGSGQRGDRDEAVACRRKPLNRRLGRAVGWVEPLRDPTLPVAWRSPSRALRNCWVS